MSETEAAPRQIRIRSVKFDDGAVEIVATETFSDISDEAEITLKSSDEPRDTFVAPWAEFAQPVRQLLGFSYDWARDNLDIKKVVWSYSEKTEVRGATICCQAKLDCADAPLVFNTPHLPFDQYSEGGNAPVMPPALIALLDTLEGEALLFLKGARKQRDLFDAAA